MTTVTLYRFGKDGSMFWFCLLSAYTDLLGYGCLLREWGQSGRIRTRRLTVFGDISVARDALYKYKSEADFDIEFTDDGPSRLGKHVDVNRFKHSKEKENKSIMIKRLDKQFNPRSLASDAIYEVPGLKFVQSSIERIRMSDNPRETLLSEKIINIFTRQLGFGTCTLILDTAGIVTVGDLIDKTESEIRSIKGIGEKKINGIKQELADFGLCLRRHKPQETLSLKQL